MDIQDERQKSLLYIVSNHMDEVAKKGYSCLRISTGVAKNFYAKYAPLRRRYIEIDDGVYLGYYISYKPGNKFYPLKAERFIHAMKRFGHIIPEYVRDGIRRDVQRFIATLHQVYPDIVIGISKPRSWLTSYGLPENVTINLTIPISTYKATLHISVEPVGNNIALTSHLQLKDGGRRIHVEQDGKTLYQIIETVFGWNISVTPSVIGGGIYRASIDILKTVYEKLDRIYMARVEGLRHIIDLLNPRSTR